MYLTVYARKVLAGFCDRELPRDLMRQLSSELTRERFSHRSIQFSLEKFWRDFRANLLFVVLRVRKMIEMCVCAGVENPVGNILSTSQGPGPLDGLFDGASEPEVKFRTFQDRRPIRPDPTESTPIRPNLSESNPNPPIYALTPYIYRFPVLPYLPTSITHWFPNTETRKNHRLVLRRFSSRTRPFPRGPMVFSDFP